MAYNLRKYIFLMDQGDESRIGTNRNQYWFIFLYLYTQHSFNIGLKRFPFLCLFKLLNDM